MLDSTYKRAWDFDPQIQANPETRTRSDLRQKHPPQRELFGLRRKMHLRKSDENMRFGGAVGGAVGVDRFADTSNAPKSPLDSKSPRNEDLLHPNEVEIPIADEQELDAVLEGILAGWILLVQRYQRDSFTHITWRVGKHNEGVVQSITAVQLDILKLETLKDLIERVQDVRLKEIPSTWGSMPTLVLNDGSRDEWSFEVSIEIQHSKLSATFQWRPPTMSRYQACSQLRSLASILSTLFQNSERRIADIIAASGDEIEEIWGWNTPLPPTLATCMHEIISEQAHLYPEKNAVEAWDGSLTYSEIDQHSTELAQNLRLLGHCTEQIIPVLFEKSRWTMVAVLAIMKSGACFALLDPAQPEGRLRTIVEQTNATFLVSSKAQASLAARIAPSAVIIPVSQSKFSRLYRPFAEQLPTTSLPDVSPDAPMYAQFTSGSTGLPKGCILTHSQYTSGAIPRAHKVGYSSNSRVLDFASYAFDVSVDTMLCTISHGGTLCTPSEERRMNELSSAMRDMRITLAGMTPSVARTLDPDILPSLDSLAIGGEGVSASDAADWRQKTKVVNCYGPSECTVGATYNDQVGTKPYISMGTGGGCATWIVDPADPNKLVPPGAVGELLIEGPIVGNGYLNNPEKTKEVFIEDPQFLLAGSDTIPGRKGRLYKTGDLVRYDPDGNGEVIFVGRQDQQVKLRGQRIELAEIEYNMQKHLPSGTELAVEIIKPGGTGEATLVAFVAEQKKNGDAHLDGDVFATFSKAFQKVLHEMAARLGKDLPSYMVPSAYIPLWKIPLLVSCKTDRKRLREIGSSITRKDLRRFNAAISQQSTPSTKTELRLAKLWAKILGGDADFSANDNFFSMGGDSLRAMKLVAAARDEGIALAVPDMMLNPKLSAMASKAKPLSGHEATDVPAFSLLPADWDSKQARSESAELCNVSTDEVEDLYPCTPLQEGLMALSAKFSDAYVAQRVVELPVEAAERLMKAIEKVAAETPILRTRIINIPGRGLFQVVLKDGQNVREHGTTMAEYLKLDRDEPMELGKALFRYGLAQSPGSEKAHVAITTHHAVYDGWSMPLVLDRVNRAYNGLDTSRPADFKHFIKYLTELDPAVSREYWQETLHGASPHQFPPLPHKGYITQADSLLEHYVKVPTTTQSRMTLATTIRGAWALVSSLYMGHTDIVFGETLTGRSASVPSIEQIEGPMITTVPIRVQLNLGRSASDFLESIHVQTVQQIPHEHLGLQNIRRLSRDARDACDLRTGLVLHPKEDGDPDTVQSLDNAPANGFLPSDDAEAAREALKFNTYALMLVCTLDENGFLIMASFDSKCISSPAMKKVLELLDRIVTAFIENPERRIGEMAHLDENAMQNALEMRPKVLGNNGAQTVQMNGHAKEAAPMQPLGLTPHEEKIRSLLSRILGIPEPDIQPSDGFFELGGDSISAMRLVSEARQHGLSITVAQIFESRSLSELAARAGNEKEEKLVGVLSRVLNISTDDIMSQDSFFELGGDSIGAMRLVAEARSLGMHITVAQIFESDSLAQLASLAEETTSTKSKAEMDVPFAALGADANSFKPGRIQPLLENLEWSIVDIYPTRPLQQVAVEGTVDLPRYSLRYELIKFEGPIQQEKVAQSCHELVARNEVLRTVFVDLDGKCLGVVLDNFEAPYDQVAVPDETNLESFVNDYITKDIEAPKPYGSSFVSFTHFNTSSGASTLAFRISHAQYDEICLPLLFSQLSALYGGTSIPETQPFTKHVNHVVQRNIPEDRPYWQNLLAGSRMSVFKPSTPLTHRTSTSIYREFDISSRPKNITIGSIPTAAWAVVLSRRLNTRDVVFGEVATGRNIGLSTSSSIIGPTWQYVPVRIPFASTWTYHDLLRFVQDQHLNSSAHEGMGLSEIVRDCTNWDSKEVTWFDSVVHQAPRDWVEKMRFGDGDDAVDASFETLYPHSEPLREWKVQAFVQDGGKSLGIEIVTFEEWKGVGEEVLAEIGEVLGCLMEGKAEKKIFDAEAKKDVS